MDKNESKKFKAKLAMDGISMKTFCDEHHLDYSMFGQQVNGYRKMTDINHEAVNEFMKSTAAKE